MLGPTSDANGGQRLDHGLHPHDVDALARRRRRWHDGPPEPDARRFVEAPPGVADLAHLTAEADLAHHDHTGADRLVGGRAGHGHRHAEIDPRFDEPHATDRRRVRLAMVGVRRSRPFCGRGRCVRFTL